MMPPLLSNVPPLTFKNWEAETKIKKTREFQDCAVHSGHSKPRESWTENG